MSPPSVTHGPRFVRRLNPTRRHRTGPDRTIRSRRSVGCCGQRTASTDAAARRFLVLVQASNEGFLAEAAERLRRTVAELADEHPENAPHGVATISPGAVVLVAGDLGQTDDEWFARADAALYLAKERGRNRVELAGREGSRP